MTSYNQSALTQAIAKTLINYPTINPDRVMRLMAYLDKMGEFNRRDKPVFNDPSLSVSDVNDRLLQYDLQAALMMHFTEINSDYLLLDSYGFSLRIMEQYKQDYMPWYEAAVQFNLTSLADAKRYFNEDF